MHGIAGNHRAAEASFVDGHEIDERRLLEFLNMVHAQRARGLRHALDQKHARHDRIAGEVPLKVRLVRGDVLDAGGGAVPVHVDDAVDKEERIAMRQQLEDVGGLRPPQLRFCATLIHPHSLLLKSAKYYSPYYSPPSLSSNFKSLRSASWRKMVSSRNQSR